VHVEFLLLLLLLQTGATDHVIPAAAVAEVFAAARLATQDVCCKADKY
jgi:hypothetical protein